MCQRCLAQYVTEVSRIRYADIMLYPGSQHLLYRGMFLGLKFQVFLRLRLTFVTVCVCVCVCSFVCVSLPPSLHPSIPPYLFLSLARSRSFSLSLSLSPPLWL